MVNDQPVYSAVAALRPKYYDEVTAGSYQVSIFVSLATSKADRHRCNARPICFDLRDELLN